MVGKSVLVDGLMVLSSISGHPRGLQILYDLLAERTPDQSISHVAMPSFEDHCRFVSRHDPDSGLCGQDGYSFWGLIECADGDGSAVRVVGCIYLTHRCEIGISIFRAEQMKGIGPRAVRLLMNGHPRAVYYANINPKNEASAKMFVKLGFEPYLHEVNQVVFRYVPDGN